jgi:O-antigen/teichoic acid export membrane protein
MGSAPEPNPGRRKTKLVLFDQAIVSGANFVIGLVLARFLGPADYGQFVLTYNIILLIGGIQAALIISPMMVAGSTLTSEQKPRYYRAVTAQQFLFCLVVGVVILVAMKIGGPYVPQWGMDSLLWPLLFATASVLTQDFFRRYFFASDRADRAAVNDLLTHGGKFALLAGLGLAGHLTVVHALTVVGGASALGFVLAFIASRNERSVVSQSSALRQVAHKHWMFGRWLLAESLVYWCGSQLVIYMAGQVVSTSLVGAMSAAQNVVGMVNILFLALENLVPSRAAAIYANGGKVALTRYLKRVTAIGGAVILGIVLFASIWSEFWLKLFYGSAYAGYGWMIIWWSAYYLMGFLQRPLSVGLRVLGDTKNIFLASLFAAVVAITLSYPLIRFLGSIGAMIAICLVHATALAALILAFRRAIEKV